MATPIEEERYLPFFCLKKGLLSSRLLSIRERARGLERRSRQLPTPSRRRTSGTAVAHNSRPLLPTPPATSRSHRYRQEPTPGPAQQHEGSTPGTSACSIAQQARQDRERQQRLSSVDGNVPPTPPPSNTRTRPGKCLADLYLEAH